MTGLVLFPVANAAAEVDWRQREGSTINLLLISHPFVDSLTALLPEFEDGADHQHEYQQRWHQIGQRAPARLSVPPLPPAFPLDRVATTHELVEVAPSAMVTVQGD